MRKRTCGLSGREEARQWSEECAAGGTHLISTLPSPGRDRAQVSTGGVVAGKVASPWDRQAFT